VKVEDILDFTQDLPLDETLDADLNAGTTAAQADAKRCAGTWAVMAHLCSKLGEAASVLDPLICRYMTAPRSGWLDDMMCLSSLLTDLDRQ
jgi:hypothetical protein